MLSELFWSAFFPRFPAFGLNREIYFRIQSECRKMREICKQIKSIQDQGKNKLMSLEVLKIKKKYYFWIKEE